MKPDESLRELELLKMLKELKLAHLKMLQIRNACLGAASIAVPKEKLMEIINA